MLVYIVVSFQDARKIPNSIFEVEFYSANYRDPLAGWRPHGLQPCSAQLGPPKPRPTQPSPSTPGLPRPRLPYWWLADHTPSGPDNPSKRDPPLPSSCKHSPPRAEGLAGETCHHHVTHKIIVISNAFLIGASVDRNRSRQFRSWSTPVKCNTSSRDDDNSRLHSSLSSQPTTPLFPLIAN